MRNERSAEYNAGGTTLKREGDLIWKQISMSISKEKHW